MDFLAIKAQIEAARRFEAQVEGATFFLVLPSEHVWRVTVEANLDGRGRPLSSKAMRTLLDGAISGWEGVTGRHFLPDGPPEPVEFSPQACAGLLDCRQDMADRLGAELTDRRNQMRDKRESARKNSSSASSTT